TTRLNQRLRAPLIGQYRSLDFQLLLPCRDQPENRFMRAAKPSTNGRCLRIPASGSLKCGSPLEADVPAAGGAQFCSGVVEKWRARQDETGHSYVIVISTVF
ncbi:MAG TPA: hypothetical protein VN938_15425, partial [Xanthobacteraceae bacterium]|nr:hypothetical protein [Xanthobacteraceae bacterium]